MQFYESSRFIFLWLIPVLLFIFYGGQSERKKRLSRIGNPNFIEQRLMPGFSPHSRKIAVGLLFAVLFFSILALARPQWGEEKKKIERKGVDLVFLLDTSLSMLAEDKKPSRLGKSKLEIKNMIRRLKGDRVGMVAFAGSSFLQCPLTLDYTAFLLFVDALKPGFIPNPGTSLSEAIRLGVRAFPEESRKYRAMIVFTDGEDHEGGIEQALEEAKKAGVRIYALGVGTPEGEPIPLRSDKDQRIGGYKKDSEGTVVVTRLNAPLLKQIAQETGGLYFQSSASEREIEVILRHLESLGQRQLKERLISEREDHFQAFLLVAFLFLLFETLMRNQLKKSQLEKSVLTLLVFFLFSGFMDSPGSLVDKGNQQVKEKKYQSAVENYRKAQVNHPNDPVIRYDLGTSLYQLYEYADAEKELEQSLAHVKDPATKAKILYNYGNTKYRLGDFEKAIDAYKKALEIDPKDQDAKYNLEFLQKKKAQFEKKNKERQKEQQNKQQNQQQQNQQQQQEQNAQGGGGQQDQQQQQGHGQQDQQKQQQSQEQQQQQGQQRQEKNQQEQSQQGQERKEQNQESEKQQDQQPGQTGEEKKQQQPEQESSGQAKNAQTGQQGPTFQGQMTKQDALRILDVLKEGEKQLQDLRRPPEKPNSREVLKDW